MHTRATRLPFVLVLALTSGCGADTTSAPDAGGDATDAAGEVEVLDAADTSSDSVDTTGEVDAGDAPPDAEADAADAPDSSVPPPARGPGLGNLTYSDDELFRPIAWVNVETGVPEPDPDFVVTLFKPFGTNATYMHNGYLLTLVAPDSGSGPGGLLFYDVSDPRAPVLVNRVYDPHGITGGFREAHSMGFSDFDGRQHVAFHTGRGLEIWDLHNVHDPRPLSALELPGVNFGDYANVAWQLFWQGETIYVASADRGVFIVDASDPLAPVLADRGGLPNPVPPSQLGGFRIGPLFAVGNLLVVSSMDDSGGFATLDISDPHHPVLLDAHTRDLPKFYAICFAGGRVITSVRGAGARMSVWDISDPFRITLVDDTLEVDEQLYCTTQDDTLFQGAQDEVVKIDVSTPAAYRVLGRGSLGVGNPDHGQVTAFGNLVYIGNDHGTGSALMPHQREPDTTPPRVTMVHPLDGDTLQATTSRIGVVFSDNVELQSVGPATFAVRPVGGEALAGRYSAQSNVVNFEPAEPLLPGTTYEVVVAADGVRDWAGNATAETFLSTFSTAASAADEAGAPHVSLALPAPAAAGAEVTFVAQVDGDGEVLLSWSFGDGTAWTTPSPATTVAHAYAEPGHYGVVVRATNGRGWASAATRATAHGALPSLPPVASSTLVVDPGGVRAFTANRDNGTVTAVTLADWTVAWEVEVGAVPAAVALAPDGAVWVAVRDAAALVRLDAETGAELDRISTGRGSRPVSLAFDPRGRFLAAGLEGTGELLVVAYPGLETTRVLLGAHVAGLSIDADGTVRVSRALSVDGAGVVWRVETDESGLPIGGAERIELAPDTTTVDAEDRGRGVPNLLGAPALQPGFATMWVPATSANVYRGGARDSQPLNHENTVRAVALRVDATTGAEPLRRLDFNDRASPVHIGFSALGEWAFVTLQGSNIVLVLDAFTGATVGALTSVGDAPQATAVTPDGRTLLVHGYLSRGLTAFDLGPFVDGGELERDRVASVPLVAAERVPAEVLRGKRIFFDASDARMSRDGYIACASCHPDGGHDGLVWDFTDRGEGLRNTIDLRGRGGVAHGPLHWTANFDEVQDFENDIRLAFGGRGFLEQALWEAGTRSDPLGDPKSGLSRELDALAAYVSSLAAPPASPWRTDTGERTEAAERGALVFAGAGCVDCHAGARYTDSGSEGGQLPRHDVGTLTTTSGQRRGGALDGLDTPTLLGLWAGAPFLHDGSAAALADVFALAPPGSAHDVADLDASDLDDLLRYLLELE